MSIAAKLLHLDGTKTEIRTAIEEKGVVVDALTPFRDYANKIREITVGEGDVDSEPATSGDYVVRFIDYDGTVLKTEYVDSGFAATAPTTPTHPLLTFNSWNKVFTNVTSDMDVGAVYDTTDGKSHLFITLTVPTGLAPTLRIAKTTTDEMTINWGDGSSETDSTNGNIAKTHTYAAAGDYVITVECAGGYTFGHGATTSTIFYLYEYIFTKILVGANVTSIANAAFYHCISLQKIVLPNEITSIGLSVFSQCHSLQSIVFPNELTSIESSTFYQCYSLQKIVIPNKVTSIGNSLFFQCHSLQSIVFPNEITSIESSTFYQCFSLLKIVIPNKVTSIGTNVFNSCHALQSIVIPDNCVFEADACEKNYSLTTFTFKSGQTDVGNDFFFNCYSLKSVYLPATITSIADDAFSGCEQLETLEILATTPPTLNAGAFDIYSDILKIYVPSASVAAYKAATNWATLADYIHAIP